MCIRDRDGTSVVKGGLGRAVVGGFMFGGVGAVVGGITGGKQMCIRDRYLSSVIGSPVSMKSITDYLTSAGRKVSQNTVSDYVEALIESFIFYPVERFDIVGKQLLKVNNKFYMVDMGIRNHILPRKRYDLRFTIENIVYLCLLYTSCLSVPHKKMATRSRF